MCYLFLNANQECSCETKKVKNEIKVKPIQLNFTLVITFLCAETYPSPESSGTYLPQPNIGGNVRVKEYNHVAQTIFIDVLYEETFPCMSNIG